MGHSAPGPRADAKRATWAGISVRPVEGRAPKTGNRLRRGEARSG